MRISYREWRVLESIPRALSIRQLARIAGVSVSTAHRIVRKMDYLRVRFLVKYEETGLLPLLVLLPNRPIFKLPPYSRALRTVRADKTYHVVTALVPFSHLDRYLSELPYKPLVVVKGYEVEGWRPDAGLTKYDAGLLRPSTEKLDLYKLSKPVYPWHRIGAPDPIDLAILTFKLGDAFITLKKIVEKASAVDSSFREVSPQLISYHYRRHVLRMWKYNAPRLYWDVRERPLWIFYLEGAKSHVAARAIVNFPGMRTTYIDDNKAVVAGQPSTETFYHIYSILTELDVRMPLGPFFVVEDEYYAVEKTSYLWLYLREGRWSWPSEVSVKRVVVRPSR